MTDLHISSFNSSAFVDDFFFNTNMRPNNNILNFNTPSNNNNITGTNTTATTINAASSSALPYMASSSFLSSSLPLPANPNFNFLSSSFLQSPPLAPTSSIFNPASTFYSNQIPVEEAVPDFNFFSSPPLPIASTTTTTALALGPIAPSNSTPLSLSNTSGYPGISSYSTPIRKGSSSRQRTKNNADSTATTTSRKTEDAKAEERRRKNRVSSSKCYYARKQKIEQFEKSLTREKQRAISMYAKELELRNENARLKKELVLNNIRFPNHYLPIGKR